MSMSQNTAPRVLYVDDEAINQCIATEILLALGAVADTASDGLQALHLVRTGHYALLISDVEMPVMDGTALTHILRHDSRYQGLPIIACTAVSTNEEEKKLIEQGFSAVIRKPFDADALRDVLARFAAPGVGEADTDAAPFSTPPTGVPTEKDIHLPGFSVPDGLARVMGNVPLYVSLLFDFRRELANASADIRRFRQEGDMPAILAAIHKLKGVSGNVGATELYARIVDTEPRLREDAETAEKHLDTLERYVTTTLKALAEAEKTLAPTESPHAVQSEEGEGPNIDKLRPILTETLRFIRQHDTAARDAFEEAKPFLGAFGKAEAFDIQQSLDSFDFDKAESSILHLARTLELELEESDALF